MIRSMTGYGRALGRVNGREITVEIRSVNHKFFEFSSRVPRQYGYLEEKIKASLQTVVSRGKADVGVTVAGAPEGKATVEVDRALAADTVAALRELGKELKLRDDLKLSALCAFPELLTVTRAPEDETDVWAEVEGVLKEAEARFIQSREAEGARLREDLLGKLTVIEERVGVAEQRTPQTVEAYRERLTKKLGELLDSSGIDPNRILTEAAIVADRVAVDEETVRLRSHIAAFRAALETSAPVGKRLDFLVQEMNREANTIGSKAQDLQITMAVVDIKCEIEKIREQVQNIE